MALRGSRHGVPSVGLTNSLLRRRQAPDLDELIQPCRGNAVAVRTEGDRRYGAFVSVDGSQLRALARVPDSDGIVPAAASEFLAVMAEGDRPHALRNLQIVDFLAAAGFPNLDGSVEAAGRQPRAIVVERNAGDRPAEALERLELLAGICIPEHHRLVLAS